MKKMFILPAILLTILSCRNDADEPAEHISNAKTEFSRQAADEKDNLASKDSARNYVEHEIKPPVKDGGHWRP